MKLINNMSIDALMCMYGQQDFDEMQLNEIRVGLEQGVNVSGYVNHQYHWGQMQMIRKGLERNLDISKYADPRVPLNDMILMYQKLCKQKGVPAK